MRCSLLEMGKVKGPQMCSMRSGFLKVEMMMAELRNKRVSYVLGLKCCYCFGIIKWIMRERQNVRIDPFWSFLACHQKEKIKYA